MISTLSQEIINFDLLTIGLSIGAIGILGVIVILNDPKSITHRTFLYFVLIDIAYAILNFLSSQVRNPDLVLWLLRLVIFSAAWYSFIFFRFFYVFPKKVVTFSKSYYYFILPGISIVSLFTLTPLFFSGITNLPEKGIVPTAEVQPWIVVFVLTSLALVIGGFVLLFKKTRKANLIEKGGYKLISLGTFVTFSLILVFNLILPAVFLDVRFITFAPLFTIPFIVLTGYAIIKHHLFDVKLVATQILTFGLWLLLLARAIASENLTDQIFSFLILFSAIGLGILLIRSILTEVRTRERMSQLALELEVTNKELKQLDQAKSDFISIASHQLRTPLSIIKGYMSMMREGTYGPIDEKIKDPIHKVYVSNERLINLVSDLLDLSRMERGKMQYEFTPVHLGEVVEGLVTDFALVAKNKGLAFSWHNDKENDLVKADANKIRQIALNLIDNAIKYTPAGSIKVELKRLGHNVVFSVTDTGPGLTGEEAHALFQKFSRGQQESKSHTEGLGLGLYVAKLIAQAHAGELTVTSPGKGMGSTFALHLPLYSASEEKFKDFAANI